MKGFAVSMALKKMTIVSNGEGDGDKETRLVMIILELDFILI